MKPSGLNSSDMKFVWPEFLGSPTWFVCCVIYRLLVFWCILFLLRVDSMSSVGRIRSFLWIPSLFVSPTACKDPTERLLFEGVLLGLCFSKSWSLLLFWPTCTPLRVGLPELLLSWNSGICTEGLGGTFTEFSCGRPLFSVVKCDSGSSNWFLASSGLSVGLP